jgi:membrane AbrB-like protein
MRAAPADPVLARVFPPLQWGLLLVASLAAAWFLQWVRLPAALLLGPMLAAIAIGTAGGSIRIGKLPYEGAQALIGCLIARAITPTMLRAFLARWLLFVSVVAVIVLASSVLGWLVSRLRILPGTTGVWGLLPGAASVMMVMAESFGADPRLVAFMQYLRVVMVALSASTLARLWTSAPAAAPPTPDWFPPLHWPAVLGTLAVALAGWWLARRLRGGAGTLLVPALLAVILQTSGWLPIELPPWLLAAAYTLLGWTIGLRFTAEVLAHALRALPQTFLSIALLMAFCGGLGFLLARIVGVDPLTAYLATSPGGLDSVAIIAATAKVDLSFVLCLQALRFSAVLFLGPGLSRLVAKHLDGGQEPGAL